MDEAVVKPWPQVQYLNTTSNRIYQKGYLILRALEDLVGIEQMELILQTAYSEYGQNPAMSVADLKQVSQEVTGRDLDWFFQSWLYSDDGWVDFAVSSFQSWPQGNSWQTEVDVTRRGSNVQPVTVRFAAKTAQFTNKDGLLIKLETLSFTTPHRWCKWRLTGEMLPDLNRLNNTKPRKVDWTLHNDTSLDSYVMRYYPGIVPGTVLGGSADSFELGLGLSGRVRNN